jgi:DNA-binding PadR family transcriptional regulator
MPTTTLGYALLGLLARGPLSGYDLARMMRQPVGFFWHARHSQIYPELARLEAHGLVTHEVVEQRDRPDKKVYTITEDGRARLRAWIESPLNAAGTRDELVLRAFSVWLADRDRAIALFRDQQRRHLEQLAQYERFREQMEGDGVAAADTATPDFATYATLQRGLGFEREYAAWCGWMADQLEARGTPERPDSESRT